MANFAFGVFGVAMSGYNLKKEFDKPPEERSGWRIAWEVGSIGLTCVTLGTSAMLASALNKVDKGLILMNSAAEAAVKVNLKDAQLLFNLSKNVVHCTALAAKLEKLEMANSFIGAINTLKVTKDRVDEMELRKKVKSYLPKIEGDDPLYWESAYLNACVTLIPESKYDDPLFKKRTWEAPGAAQKLPIRFPVMVNLGEGAQLYEYSFALLMARKIENKELEENLWRGVDLDAIKEINERLKEMNII